jgi:hypothetical protein
MPLPPLPGRCVHCLEFHEKLTWDHIFPAAWYPETTPDGLEKWKVPSCQLCNSANGESENVLMGRVGLCLDPSSPQGAGISAKAVRSMDPSAGRNARDVAARAGKQRELMTQMSYLAQRGIPRESVFPGFGPEEWPGEPLTVIPVPKRAIDRLVEKIVRGITYLEEGAFIEETHVIEPQYMQEESARFLHEQFVKFGKRFERKPGLVIDRCATPEDSVSSIFRIEIWGRLRVYAFVSQRSQKATG